MKAPNWFRNLFFPTTIKIEITQDMTGRDNYKDTHNCPLAQSVNKTLRRQDTQAGIAMFWSGGHRYDMDIPFRYNNYIEVRDTGIPFITYAKKFK